MSLYVEGLGDIIDKQTTFLKEFAKGEKNKEQDTQEDRGKVKNDDRMLYGVETINRSDALDLVSRAPDQLMALYPKGMNTMAEQKLWHRDALSLVISVSEAVEVASYIEAAARTLLTNGLPERESDTRTFYVVWQAHPGPTAMQHRVKMHALFLLVQGETKVLSDTVTKEKKVQRTMTATLKLGEEGTLDAEDMGKQFNLQVPPSIRGSFLAESCAYILTPQSPVGVDEHETATGLMVTIATDLLKRANDSCRKF